MSKHIGILAHSAEGATLSYQTAWREGVRKMGAHRHPRITMGGLCMAEAMPLWEANDLQALRRLFLEDAERLATAGADFFILPDNTAHLALEHPGPDFPLPCLHIAEVVAGHAKEQGYGTIGVLGTNWTMEGSVYENALARFGLRRKIPEMRDREYIHNAIFNELCLGEFNDSTRRRFIRIIADMKEQGCDAVALVCTEIPLLITSDTSPLPILDSTRLQAYMAVMVATEEAPMPKWFGGPLGC